MNETFYSLQSTLSLVAPITGAVIMFLAWKRFSSPGAKLALIGFAVIASGGIALALFNLFWDPGDLASARDWSIVLNSVGAIGLAGMLITVFALHRLIASAEVAEAENTVGVDIS